MPAPALMLMVTFVEPATAPTPLAVYGLGGFVSQVAVSLEMGVVLSHAAKAEEAVKHRAAARPSEKSRKRVFCNLCSDKAFGFCMAVSRKVLSEPCAEFSKRT